jgi:4-amino-4-deoxy-L-arabinose transferase-like glycosyltransferase
MIDWFERSRGALLFLALLYLVPRALLILFDVVPTSDADFYYTRAVSLAEGKGYLSNSGLATAYWPPGWSMALSLAFRSFGSSLAVVGLFNLACAAVSGWLVLALGRRLFGSELAARSGLLLLALYPNNAAYVPLALTEVFYTTLLLGACWLLIGRSGSAAPSWLGLVAAGLIMGVATLVKAQTLVVVPLVLGIGVLQAPRFWRAIPGAAARTMLVIATAALVIAPWTLRNHRELGAWALVSTNGGITLLTGNNDSANGGYSPEDPAVLALNARIQLNELEYDAEAKRLGFAWIEANPGRFTALMPLKLLRLWGPDGEAIWSYERGATAYPANAGLFTAVRLANQAWYLLLLLGFAVAAIVMIRHRLRTGLKLAGWWLLPYGIAAYPTAVCLIFSGQSRFHFPAMPFIAMTCGWLLAQWLLRERLEADETLH